MGTDFSLPHLPLFSSSSFNIAKHLIKKKRFQKTYFENRNKLTDLRTNLRVTIGEAIGEREELGGWEHIHTTV